ncbi:hypothetical protein K9K77_00870 [Candidatus Babeliales bacterium]|nr:hypothetical protein [Candidatus Babeliales bacterium]
MDVLKNLLGMLFKLFGKKQMAVMPVLHKNTSRHNVKKQSHKEEQTSNRNFNPMRWK